MYAVSGKTTCSLDNKLTAAKCPATSCKVEAPANGMAGDCPAFLASSKSCTPTCKEGFSASGPTHCDMGKLTATSICKEAGCTGIVAPVNGGLGTCTAEMDSCTTCEFTCNEGYARSGRTACTQGVLDSAVRVGSCTVAAPKNGLLGTCSSSIAAGSSCKPKCKPGYTLSGGQTSCDADGKLTAATCEETPCTVSAPMAQMTSRYVDACGTWLVNAECYVSTEMCPRDVLGSSQQCAKGLLHNMRLWILHKDSGRGSHAVCTLSLW